MANGDGNFVSEDFGPIENASGIFTESFSANEEPKKSDGKPTYLDGIIPDVHYNPLQNYRNTTYNTRLTMMPVSESAATRPQRSYDYKKGIIMWETGGTGTINLEEMTMESVGTGGKTGTYIVQQYHKFTAKLVEPVGGRFIESAAISALTLGYPNPSESMYLLEITFVGYNTNSDLPEICKGWDGEELIFRWYVKMQTLKMKLDYKGSTYDIEMIGQGGEAQLSDHFHFESGISMKKNLANIQSFLDELTTAMNKNEEDKVNTGQRCYPHVYKIIAHKEIGSLPMEDPSFIGRWVPLFRSGSMTLPPGHTIQRFILDCMPNSKEVLRFLHRIPEKKKYGSIETNSASIHLMPKTFSIICGAKAREQNGTIMFDNKIGTTAKEVVYFLTTKMDSKNIISPNEFEDAWTQQNREKRVNEFLKLGLLRKVYKWIYTGENTEVINVDLKLDYLWRLVRPLYINDKGVPVASGASNPQPAQRGQHGNPPVNCNEARMINATSSKEAPSYAEDMPHRAGAAAPNWQTDITPKPGWYPHMPQTAIINTTVQSKDTQGALSPENAQEYSIYRQLSNAQGQGNADLMQLTFEVVGDPYYLMQIPGKPGHPPYEEDVWEYIEKNLTEEQMAVTRKKTASHNWLPYIYFEARIPAVDTTSDDLMNLRQADTITGIYSTKKVVNKFIKGKFTTTLETYRDSLSNPVGKEPSATTASNFVPHGSGTAAQTGPNNADRRAWEGMENLRS